MNPMFERLRLQTQLTRIINEYGSSGYDIIALAVEQTFKREQARQAAIKRIKNTRFDLAE